MIWIVSLVGPRLIITQRACCAARVLSCVLDYVGPVRHDVGREPARTPIWLSQRGYSAGWVLFPVLDHSEPTRHERQGKSGKSLLRPQSMSDQAEVSSKGANQYSGRLGGLERLQSCT